MEKLTRSECGRLGAEKSRSTTKKLFDERVEKYLENPKICKNCLGVLPYNKRINDYCTRSCSVSFNNKGIRRHGDEPQNCLQCNKKLIESKKKYCSLKCFGQHKSLLWKEEVDQAQEFVNCSTNTIKKYIIELKGYCCSVCNITEWRDLPVPLVMDHIDGDPYNNKIDNLRLVCGNCDMQLSTYKSKNKGKGRHSRRERYAEGKSF